jgi:hypothetical protein
MTYKEKWKNRFRCLQIDWEDRLDELSGKKLESECRSILQANRPKKEKVQDQPG